MATRTCGAETSSTPVGLSPALKELLQALIEAPESDCNALGERLCRAPRTVRKEMEMLYERLGVGGKNARAAALVRAQQLGWIMLPALPDFSVRGGGSRMTSPKVVKDKAHALLWRGIRSGYTSLNPSSLTEAIEDSNDSPSKAQLIPRCHAGVIRL